MISSRLILFRELTQQNGQHFAMMPLYLLVATWGNIVIVSNIDDEILDTKQRNLIDCCLASTPIG
jgi:hypothetical protein